jgi:hypothetical protein
VALTGSVRIIIIIIIIKARNILNNTFKKKIKNQHKTFVFNLQFEKKLFSFESCIKENFSLIHVITYLG